MTTPNPIVLLNPKKLIFGAHSLDIFIEDFIGTGLKRLFLLSISDLKAQLLPKLHQLETAGVAVETDTSISKEPSFYVFEELLNKARIFKADAIDSFQALR